MSIENDQILSFLVYKIKYFIQGIFLPFSSSGILGICCFCYGFCSLRTRFIYSLWQWDGLPSLLETVTRQ